MPETNPTVQAQAVSFFRNQPRSDLLATITEGWPLRLADQMDDSNAQFDTTAPDDACGRNVASETRPSSLCPLLRMPPELRLLVYRSLFAGLKVTIHRNTESKHDDFCAIMRTCKVCHAESVIAFYESVTVTLKHEAFLYVLRRRIGLHNMVRIRNLLVAGFQTGVGESLALQVPDSVENLYIEWKEKTESIAVSPPERASDSQIRQVLDIHQRFHLAPCVRQLWARNPKLRIWLTAAVGSPGSDEVRPSLVFSSNKLSRVGLDSAAFTSQPSTSRFE